MKAVAMQQQRFASLGFCYRVRCVDDESSAWEEFRYGCRQTGSGRIRESHESEVEIPRLCGPKTCLNRKAQTLDLSCNFVCTRGLEPATNLFLTSATKETLLLMNVGITGGASGRQQWVRSCQQVEAFDVLRMFACDSTGSSGAFEQDSYTP